MPVLRLLSHGSVLWGLFFATSIATAQPALPVSATPSDAATQTRGSDGAADYELRIIDASPTLTQATAINAAGAIIGSREILDGMSLRQVPFFYWNDQRVDILALPGFTEVQVSAISDQGLVSGYCSRGPSPQGGSLVGLLWDHRTRKLTALSPLPGDRSSHAQDIDANGTRITGYSTGANPPRMRPCVWQWDNSLRDWQVAALPTIHEYNPYLLTSQVVISPNGQRIAACITMAKIPGAERYDSSLVMWERENGAWRRKPVHDSQPRLTDLNDAGTVVGSGIHQGQRRALQVSRSGELQIFELLPGDVSGVAYGINNHGTICGISDDPAGPDGGPTAFVYRDGAVSPLPLPPETCSSAALAIDSRGDIAGYLERRIETEESEPIIVAFIWLPKSAPTP